MSHKFQQWQCNFCFAYFPSDDLLQSHLDEYRSRELSLSAELEKCRAHANTNRDDDSENPSDNESEELEIIQKNTKCPYPGCSRTAPFGTGQQLRVHYQRHITCEEVCVFCFKVFRITSEYIRHTREHSNGSETKRTYTTQTSNNLRWLANKGLETCLKLKTVTKKRTWEEAAIDSAGSCDLPSDGAGVLSDIPILLPNDYPAHFTSASMEQVMPITPRPDLTSTPLHGTAEQQIGLAGIATQPPGGDEYDAPLFYHLNFGRFPASMGKSVEFEHVPSSI